MKKKFLSLLVASSMMMTTLATQSAISVSAAVDKPTFTCEVSSSSGKPGDEFTVKVSYESDATIADDITGLRFFVAFPGADFTVSNVTEGDVLSSGLILSDTDDSIEEGTYTLTTNEGASASFSKDATEKATLEAAGSHYVSLSMSATTGANFDGELLTFTLKAKSAATAGEKAINLAIAEAFTGKDGVDSFDQDAYLFADGEVEVVNATITLEEGGGEPGGKLGDVNADGVVNAIDCALIFNYFMSGSSAVPPTFNLANADVNADKNINAIDAAIAFNWFMTGA